ncbi:MAG: DUF167 domain-containing protein [Gaiella sp.]
MSADARPHARLKLRVSPGASRASVVGRFGDAWKVRVAALPERGRANDEIEQLLAGSLGIGTDDVQIVAGRGARDKVVRLTGVTRDVAERKLGAACSGVR